MSILFKNAKHEEFYLKSLIKSRGKDVYSKALFYTLGLNDDAKKFVDRLYDFDKNCINVETLNDGWQTSGSIRICRLAFNLYNGYVGNKCDDNYCPAYFSPYHLMADSNLKYMLQAIEIRYPEYMV